MTNLFKRFNSTSLKHCGHVADRTIQCYDDDDDADDDWNDDYGDAYDDVEYEYDGDDDDYDNDKTMHLVEPKTYQSYKSHLWECCY